MSVQEGCYDLGLTSFEKGATQKEKYVQDLCLPLKINQLTVLNM